MEEITVTEFRQNLREYLKKAERGRRVRITLRGQPIAELSAPVASRREVDAARARLRHSVLRYERPFEPAVDPNQWEVNR